MNAHELDAIDALRAIESGTLSHESWVRACLERISYRDAEVQAFTALAESQALAQARQLDQSPSSRPSRLAGLPFAVKDVLDSADLPTQHGSPIYQGHQPGTDAACIALAKEAGAILIGKTATCEFATLTPSATRNPLDLRRTPGGSSSGSAAAVADYMVPIALGTQTSASIIRPAAYCGVIGYKPSFDVIHTAGLKHASPLLDTIGVFSRSVRDAHAFVLGGVLPDRTEPPRFKLLNSTQWNLLEPCMLDAAQQFVKTLRQAGGQLSEGRLSPLMEEALSLQERVSSVELYASLSYERQHHPTLLSERIRTRMRSAQPFEPKERLELLRRTYLLRQGVDGLFGDADVLIYPAATGEAPLGQETGHPGFGRLWTLLQTPAICIPIDAGPAGLPLGIQLIARPYEDARLLQAAAWAHTQAGSPVAGGRRAA